MNILITSISRKVSLVKAFQKALTQEGGGTVTAVDISPYAPALYFADRHFLVPESADPHFIEVIKRLCNEHCIRAIIPTRDDELMLFSKHKEEFAALGVFVMVPKPDVVNICQDKKAFIEFCRKYGFLTPRNYDPSTDFTDADFPLFVKPRFGKGSHGIVKVSSKKEMDIALEKNQEAIIQEFIDANEYTIDLFADLQSRVISAVPRQRMLVFGGESFVTKIFKHKKLIESASMLATKLGLIGHNTIQAFFDGKMVKFIEVNPRYGGAANMGFHAGVLTPVFLIRLLNGIKVEPILGDFKDNLVMLRYTNDIFIDDSSMMGRVL